MVRHYDSGKPVQGPNGPGVYRWLCGKEGINGTGRVCVTCAKIRDRQIDLSEEAARQERERVNAMTSEEYRLYSYGNLVAGHLVSLGWNDGEAKELVTRYRDRIEAGIFFGSLADYVAWEITGLFNDAERAVLEVTAAHKVGDKLRFRPDMVLRAPFRSILPECDVTVMEVVDHGPEMTTDGAPRFSYVVEAANGERQGTDDRELSPVPRRYRKHKTAKVRGWRR